MIDPNVILEQVFDGGAADMYALIDELGNAEASRILHDADVLMWINDSVNTAAKIRYNYFGNNAVLITLVESKDFDKSRYEIMRRMALATEGINASYFLHHDGIRKSNEGVLLYE